jgi:hypothetical protein
VNKLARQTKPPVLSSRVSLLKEDWDFIVGIAKQHARISDATLAAMESQEELTKKLQRCQSLYLAFASEVAAITHYGDRSKLKHAVQDVLKDVVDSRVVAWAMDDMMSHKPSSLDEMLAARQGKIDKKLSYAKRVREYNQSAVPPAPQRSKKRSYNHDR